MVFMKRFILLFFLFASISSCFGPYKAPSDNVIIRQIDFANNLTLFFYQNSINVRDQYGNTPLIASMKSENKEIALLLLNSGANINLQDNSGYTPLMSAIDSQNLEVANLLIKKGANVNIQSNSGDSSLIIAIARYYKDLDELIFRNTSQFNIENRLSKESFTSEVELLNKNVKYLIETLLNKGANIDLQYDIGDSALILAIENGNHSIIKYISDSQNLNSVLKNKNEDLKNFIINKGANINLQNNIGNSSLMIESEEGKKI